MNADNTDQNANTISLRKPMEKPMEKMPQANSLVIDWRISPNQWKVINLLSQSSFYTVRHLGGSHLTRFFAGIALKRGVTVERRNVPYLLTREPCQRYCLQRS